MQVLITGTSRGIGLELTEVALRAGHTVLAVAREPQKSERLKSLKDKYQTKLELVAVDLTQSHAIEQIVEKVKSHGHLDRLINNAGIMRQGENLTDFMESFQVNSVTPFLLTTALLPFLKNSEEPKVVHITSLMGSIEDNKSGGYYAYRSSKTALNMINKSLTIDNPWLTTAVVHPGWVQTDMGGDNAPVKPADSAKGIWQVMETLGKDRSGSYVDFQGKKLPW